VIRAGNLCIDIFEGILMEREDEAGRGKGGQITSRTDELEQWQSVHSRWATMEIFDPQQ